MCGYGSADLSCDSQHFSRQCLSWMKVGFPLATIKTVDTARVAPLKG